jgi:hypothetical protein
MRNKFLKSIVLLCLFSCTKSEISYYLDKEENPYSIKEMRNDTIYRVNYYINGNVDFKAKTLSADYKVCGLLEEYYPDGFPKNKCMMDKGINVTPKQTGKHSGYEVKIDFGQYEVLSDGRVYRPFRTFVDGVSTDEYIVAIADTNGHDFLPKQLPRNMKKYKIVYGEDLQDTNEVEIDETMYPYYVEDMDLAKLVNTNGDTCFLVYFYYKSVLNYPYPNDERMVVMHDSLNWEVTEFIKHYR